MSSNRLSALNRSNAQQLLCVLLGALLLLSGCVAPIRQSPQNAVNAPVEDGLRHYLETMQQIGGEDPARQADVFYEVQQEHTRAPTTANTLRYALSTPGHPGSNAAEGKRILEILLATPERLSAAERALATVTLRNTNFRLKLESDHRRLLATLDERARTQANFEKRVQTQLEENVRLRRELDEAQRKLNAITDIERDIIERRATPPGSRDIPGEKQSPPPGR